MPFRSSPSDTDGSPPTGRAVTWLRVLKLLLTVVLLAIGIIEALGRLGVG